MGDQFPIIDQIAPGHPMPESGQPKLQCHNRCHRTGGNGIEDRIGHESRATGTHAAAHGTDMEFDRGR